MRIPSATYRVQFNRSFGFQAAKRICGYLAELGISDLYASPVFYATQGSAHGYDICDPDRLNDELGTQDDFEALVHDLQQRGMGWVQDIVPNHMAYDSRNWRLMSALENGPDSTYAGFFDMDWSHPCVQGKIMAPFLGRHYPDCLEKGEIGLRYDSSGLSVCYFGLSLPLRIDSYRIVFASPGEPAGIPEDVRNDYRLLDDILGGGEEVPPAERHDRAALLKEDLWNLHNRSPAVRDWMARRICAINGRKGYPESRDLLDSLAASQYFRLSFWKSADQEINYRRFFTVNQLISVRVESELVFRDTHAFLLKLVREGKITGLRVDHVDGLYDPARYLHRLRESAGDAYIIVEKILVDREELPREWPVQGTTGYDFLNLVNGIFCRRENELSMTETYLHFSRMDVPYRELLRADRDRVLRGYMAGDIDNLAQALKEIAGRSRYGRDFTFHGLREALSEVLILLPVYRTYISSFPPESTDGYIIRETVDEAVRRKPGLAEELHFIRGIILGEEKGCPVEEKPDRLHFSMRIQQFSGPLMAKGVEDTLLYHYGRLLSLNEVGGNPGRFGLSLKEFHEFNQKRGRDWPHTLNATSTHDTKRGEDSRARINILSEIPDEWKTNVTEWARLNRRKKQYMGKNPVPDGNTEYFIYQTLVGAFPNYEAEYQSFLPRMKEYMVKASREAKVHTSWSEPDSMYEKALCAFIEKILKTSRGNRFLFRFLPFQKKISYYGCFNSLSQTLIKITAPGVPDFYQGTETWDFHFVDPDNRRPVDYERRIARLDDLKKEAEHDLAGLLDRLASDVRSGDIKMFLIWRALWARNRMKEVFLAGQYMPLEVTGTHAGHVIAFMRMAAGGRAVTVTPRFLTSLIREGERPLGHKIWKDTAIAVPDRASWTNALTGEVLEDSPASLSVGAILSRFPVALLLNEAKT
ncbi:MAG: malto-oligosyltrehalose synthase [Syntrophales bacterium]